ncbi:hypothetical protein ONV78_01095 [Hahella sp. CR1]|uniref:hypothetical protein n=1 Tax=Hahella sp. CR1 TaxID=2992807 RepID=UPI002443488D|nr:hypothetical protein [Hahella sp. CR1]MDG9666309.1 hypothetical protein [Hahella sp. CR1]
MSDAPSPGVIGDFPGKRWLKIALRTLHILSVAGVCGGIWFGHGQEEWRGFWMFALASGLAMLLLDLLSNWLWLVQVRGAVILSKFVLFSMLGVYPSADRWLLTAIIVASVVISHAPGSIRYYSLLHRRVMRSLSDMKG